MSQLSKKLRDLAGDGLAYWCQGCEKRHVVWIDAPDRPCWTWNGNAERPTFAPSVLVRWTEHMPPVTPENLEEWKVNPWSQTDIDHICHTFITDGRVQFLGDCTHRLAGQTLELPDLPQLDQDPADSD